MKGLIGKGVDGLDRRLAAASLRRGRERPALLGFVFHSLFEDEREVARGLVDPYQRMLVSDFQRFIEYFIEHGYRCVTPADILAGLDPAGHYVLITFDDGYANQLRAIPVLRAFGVPATFFVAVHHVADGKAFWWDALHRERRRRGTTDAAIESEKTRLKRWPYHAIEAYLHAELGRHALQPSGDTDRPMTPAELMQLAAEPLAAIGNHTADHALLTMYDDTEVRAQIRICQDDLTALTGNAPAVIAYPNGGYNARVLRLARAEGLRLGLVVEARKNRLPLTADAQMTIARYLVSGGPALRAECELCRSDVQLGNLLRRIRGLR